MTSNYQYDPQRDGRPPKKITDHDKQVDWLSKHFDKDRHFDIKQFAGKDYITGGAYQKYKESDKKYKKQKSML